MISSVNTVELNNKKIELYYQLLLVQSLMMCKSLLCELYTVDIKELDRNLKKKNIPSNKQPSPDRKLSKIFDLVVNEYNEADFMELCKELFSRFEMYI